jgi:tetratricopeptide (TPR) repeat protein
MLGRLFAYLAVLFLVLFTACKDERSNEGDKHFARGDYKKAVQSYNEYLSLYPEHIKSIYNRGRAYEELGQYDKAMKDFRHVLKREPNHVRALLSVANDFYVRKKDYENTIFYADKVLEQDSKNALAYILKGRAQQKLGRLTPALSSYNNAISVNKNYADAYISRGSLRLVAKQPNKACNDFQTAAALGSEQATQLLSKYCD